jgi:hypothetical protein
MKASEFKRKVSKLAKTRGVAFHWDPSAAKGKQRLIAVPLWIAPKSALYRAQQEQGVSNSELARRLGVRETIVGRMLDPDRATKTARLEGALRAVGERLLVAIHDAA